MRAVMVGVGWLFLEAAAAAVLAAQPAAPVVLRPYGTLQVQFSSTSVDDAAAGAGVVPTTFETRRVRFGTVVRVGEALSGRVESELAMGRLQLRNAWLEYLLAGTWALRVGQYKKPFGLMQLTGHLRTPTIERAVRIRGLAQALALEDAAAGAPVLGTHGDALLLPDEQTIQDVLGYHGYDMGAMLHGRAGRLGLQVGVFNGSGADRVAEAGVSSAAARLTYTIAGPLVLGAATSYREALLAGAGSARVGGWAWTLDAQAGTPLRPGPSLLGAVTAGDQYSADDRFLVAHVVGTWFAATRLGHFDGIEAVGRVAYADPQRRTAADEALLLTPGLNLYVTDRNRLMLNWDLFLPRGDRFSAQHAFRAQAQLSY